MLRWHESGWYRGAVSAVIAGWLALAAASGEVPAAVETVGQDHGWAFPVGEELVYRVYWGIIPVGTATVTTEWYRGETNELLAIRYRAQSNKVIARIYPVDSRIESLVDPVTFRSVRFLKDMKEGRHRYHEVTVFDYDELKAHWFSLIKNTTKEFPLEADTRDLVAFLYHIRLETFEPGGEHNYRVMADDDIYDLKVKVRGRETVDLPKFGKVSSLRMEPEAAFNGIFVRKGKVTVWVSDDDRRVFTRILAELPFANVRAILSEVRGPGADAWVQAWRKRAGK